MEQSPYAVLFIGKDTNDEIPAKLFLSLYEQKDLIEVCPGPKTYLHIKSLESVRPAVLHEFVKEGNIVEPFDQVARFLCESYKVTVTCPLRRLRKTNDTKYYYGGWIPRVPIISRHLIFASTELAQCIDRPLESVPPEVLILNHLVQAHKWVARYFSNGDLSAFAYLYQLLDRTLREKKEQIFFRDIEKLIELFVWFRDMEERVEIEQARMDFGILPKLNLAQIWPADMLPLDELYAEILRNRPEVRSAVSDKKNKQKLEFSNNSVRAIWDKLEKSGVQVKYDKHPLSLSPTAAASPNSVVPWDILPTELDPSAGSMKEDRAERKRLQINNLVHIAKGILRDGDTVVDFCGGGGHLSLVFAWLFPKIRVILVDRNEISLAWAKRRLGQLQLSNCEVDNCDIREWNKVIPFQMGLAIHSCGALADIIMEKCMECKASFIVAPCCFGSLKNNNAVNLPRSQQFKKTGITVGEYVTLACSADKGTESWDFQGNTYTCGKRSMGFIDTDRALRAQEDGYNTFHFTMVPETCSPKNEILFGVSPLRQEVTVVGDSMTGRPSENVLTIHAV